MFSTFVLWASRFCYLQNSDLYLIWTCSHFRNVFKQFYTMNKSWLSYDITLLITGIIVGVLQYWSITQYIQFVKTLSICLLLKRELKKTLKIIVSFKRNCRCIASKGVYKKVTCVKLSKTLNRRLLLLFIQKADHQEV